MLFDLVIKSDDMCKPLTPKILSDPEHPVTKHILYLYSMESFIYSDMNKASRDKELDQIKFYGGFASVLSYIIYNANNNRRNTIKLKNTTELFRGLCMSEFEADAFVAGSKINLLGYTSTSRKFTRALKFATMDVEEGKIPVIFEIYFNGSTGLFELTEEYTAYPKEDEVLIQDGL